MKMEPIVSSETSAIRTQTPGNYPKRNNLHLEHGESLRTLVVYLVNQTLQHGKGTCVNFDHGRPLPKFVDVKCSKRIITFFLLTPTSEEITPRTIFCNINRTFQCIKISYHRFLWFYTWTGGYSDRVHITGPPGNKFEVVPNDFHFRYFQNVI